MALGKDTPIILLHGLHALPITQLPLECALNWHGFKNTHRIHYANGGATSFEMSVDDAAKQIRAVVNENCPVVLIGRSLGGVIAAEMHRKGINVAHIITMSAPLHGARLINTIEAILPTFFRNLLHEEIYDFLKTKGKQPEPPHTYTTISGGWGWSNFDRLVYSDEAAFDKKHHIHFTWMDHALGDVDPRCWYAVINDLSGRVK